MHNRCINAFNIDIVNEANKIDGKMVVFIWYAFFQTAYVEHK